MANIWLRVALALYGLGLLYILVALTRSRKILNSLALHAAYLGMIFHFVAIAETVQQSGELSLASLSLAASILGFLIMVVFLLTFVGLSAQEPVVLTSSVARQGWLIAHISLIFAGYAALVLSFSASLIYLIQENILKSKRPGGLLARLPSLQVTDEIGFRSLLIG